MPYNSQAIIKQAIKPKNKEKLDILCFDTHERCQSQMAKTGHNFYSFRYKDCKVWNTAFADIPENYHPIENLYSEIDYDFILSQSKFGQLQISKQIQAQLGLPIVHLSCDQIYNFYSLKYRFFLPRKIACSTRLYNRIIDLGWCPVDNLNIFSQ